MTDRRVPLLDLRTGLSPFEQRIVELVRTELEEAVHRERNRCAELVLGYRVDESQVTEIREMLRNAILGIGSQPREES